MIRFDITVLNQVDRFDLAQDVIDRLPQMDTKAAYLKQALRDKLLEHNAYIREDGVDMPEVENWRWGG